MPEFLEERLPVGIKIGASYSDEYNVEITKTAAGSEYRRLVHKYPVRVFNVSYTQDTATLWANMLALYHRAYGMFAGFRVKSLDDYTTNGRINAPTALDQALALVSAGVYQLQVTYGVGGTALGIGRPVRTIFKPVTGTTKVAIANITQAETIAWSVNTTTGKVTFAANKTRAVTGITIVNGTTVTATVAAHTFVVNDTVHFSGILGMTQINGKRGTVLSQNGTTITVDVGSTAGFGTWSAGGTQAVNTNPQAGETVTGGCEFDIPCRFNSRIDVTHISHAVADSNEIEIIEILNP